MISFRRARGGGISSPSRSSRSLTASGARIKHGRANEVRRLIQPWQSLALFYYDKIPEIKYGGQFFARHLSALELYAGYRNDDGEIEPTENPDAIEQLDRVQDPGGGRTRLLGSYSRLRFLTGESYLLVSQDPETGLEQWEMLSSDELRIMGEQYMRFKAPALQPENYHEADDDDYAPVEDDKAVAYRLWNPHPRYSSLADCSMQGVLDVCEELLVLTQAVRANGLSRLARAGILLLNDKYLPKDLQAGADDDPEADPVLRDLIDAASAAIKDPSSPAAVVPIVLRIDADKIDDVMKHIQISDLTALYPEGGLRFEAVKRLATGLDMPPEILLGISDTNHWNAWIVDEHTWKGHLQPIADQFVGDLSSAFYRPTLRDLEVENWDRYCIGYDATAIINHPDRGKDAMDLHDRGEISGESLREAKGFDENAAPSDLDRQRFAGIKIRDGSLFLYGIPSVRTAIEPAPGELETGSGTTDAGASTGVAKEAPAEPTQKDEKLAAFELEARVARVLAACDMMLLRSRELAGNKLRNRAKRDVELVALLTGVLSTQVAPTLGRERAAALGVGSERELVVGARDMLAQTLERWGFDPGLAEPLADRIEQHAARHLYDENPPSLPQTFANYVAGLVAVKP